MISATTVLRYSVSVTFVGDQFVGIITLTVSRPIFYKLKENAKFQLEVSENKDLNFYLNVNGILKILYLLQLILVTCFNVKI